MCYKDVDDVTIGFAANGVTLSFYGEDSETNVSKRWLFVYPSLEVALDLVKDISECQEK
jgi:hypothetical protein